MYHGHIPFKLTNAMIQAVLSTSRYVAKADDTFSDLVDGVLHCEPGTNKDKFLPLTVEDAEKGPHHIPFNPSAKTANLLKEARWRSSL